MIVPFMLTVLQPLCPALFLRELLRWLIGSVGAWLIDEDYAGWLKQSRDKAELRSLLSFVLMIEEGLCLLVYVRARQKLGHKARPGRRLKPRPCPLPGHPPSFTAICLRFERACLAFADHERLAERRALKLKRLLAAAGRQLETVHHPIASTTTIFQFRASTTIPGLGSTSATTIFPFGLSATIFSFHARHPAQAIRAPP